MTMPCCKRHSRERIIRARKGARRSAARSAFVSNGRNRPLAGLRLTWDQPLGARGAVGGGRMGRKRASG